MANKTENKGEKKLNNADSTKLHKTESKYDFVKAKDYVFGFIKNIIDKHGPRLPGSEEEHAASYDIEKYIKDATGKEVVREPFKVSPVASIGAIPVIGMVGFALLILYYVNPILSLILTVLTFAYAVIQIFMYKGWFDKLWKRHESQNLYSVIDGGDKIDYTIVFSGHMDSSWNWNHSLKRPQLVPVKIGLFLASYLGIIVFSIIRIVQGKAGNFFNLAIDSTADALVLFLPILLLVGLYYGATFLSWDKKIAAPGAMDNLTGVGSSIFMGKYYTENPDKLPKNCRIIVAALGSEEAGLKGSFEFVRRHKDDKELLINPIVINIDSVSDYDYFGVISGDLWQMTNFDPELIGMALDTFKSLGLKTQSFKNPVGGCDSTPFCKAGIPTVTLCAQNPVATTYYHTKNDHYDRLNQDTLQKGLEGLVILADKLHEKHKIKSDK